VKVKTALFQLGTDLEEAPTRNAEAPQSRQAQAEGFNNRRGGPNSGRDIGDIVGGPWTATDERHDYFVVVDGEVCAGKHLIIDIWGAKHLTDMALMESTLRRCVVESGATLLHIHLHRFMPNGGISGVAVLSESHISVHTWPERDYAAFDVFMCGAAEPEKCIDVLQEVFQPSEIKPNLILRGRNN
jgi:S-adenosylmethionine decarboxylase